MCFRKNKLLEALVCATVLAVTVSCAGCLPISAAKKTVKFVGAAGYHAVRTGWKVTAFTSKHTYRLGRNLVYMAKGKIVVPLQRYGNQYTVEVIINGRRHAELIVDTGAASVQISRALAEKLNMNLFDTPQVPITLAGGIRTVARRVTLKHLSVAGARVDNVEALVFESDDGADGLLGMSFLRNFNFHFDPDNDELILKPKPPA